MLRPASKKHIRTISVSLVLVLASRPSFPSRKLKNNTEDVSLVCEEYSVLDDVVFFGSFLPAGSVSKHPSQPAQDVQGEALSMLRSVAALCPPAQRIQELLMKVWELQHGTALDPEQHGTTKNDILVQR